MTEAEPVEEKKPFYVHCKDCGHVWVWFYTPIRMDALGKFKPHPCPKCHSEKVLCGRGPSATPADPVR